MKILVCGGRDFDDLQLFMDKMNEIDDDLNFDGNQPITIIEGGAKGADFLARCWAKYCGWQHEPYPADWKRYGRAAGSMRNSQMLFEGKPDYVIAFPGGPGTADMVGQAKAVGVKVYEIK